MQLAHDQHTNKTRSAQLADDCTISFRFSVLYFLLFIKGAKHGTEKQVDFGAQTTSGGKSCR
jgi:hypothetical protein